MPARDRLLWIIPGILVIVAITLRASDLGSTCLWFDEVFSFHAASHPWSSLFHFVAADLIHPPLYYVALKLWIAGGGESVHWLRGLSAVWFLLSLIPAFLLLRELKLSVLQQIITLSILLMSSQLLKYSLEVRMYAQLWFLAAFAIWLFVRIVNGRSSWLILAIADLMLVHTHYFGWFLVLSQLIAAAILYREYLRRVAVAVGMCVLGSIPWLYIVFRASASPGNIEQNIGWVKPPGLRDLLVFGLNLIEPFYFQSSSDQSASAYLVTLPLLLLLIAATVLCALRPPKGGLPTEPIVLCLILAATPILTAFVVSWIMPHSIWGTRHLLIVLLPVAIVVSTIIAGQQLRARTGLASAMLLLAAGGLYVHLAKTDSQPVWCACEDLARQAAIEKALPIYTLEDLTAYHTWFAVRREATAINRVKGGFGMPEDPAYFLPRGFDGVRVVSEEQIVEPEFHLIYRARSWNESEPPLRNLAVKGYQIRLIRQMPAGLETAFLVEARKLP